MAQLKPNLLGYLQIREYVEQDQVIIPTRLDTEWCEQ